MNRTEKYVSTFSEMIQFETISNRENNDINKFRNFHKLLAKLFPYLFEQCEVNDYNGSLLIKWQGKKHDKPILFMNHQDVVPADGEWKYPPFSATQADEKIWGRGALDTKGGLFAMFQAADELIKDGFVPEQDIYFESACDEESLGAGCFTIMQDLKKKGIKFEYSIDEGGMIVYEPLSGAKGNYAMVGLSERGDVKIEFIARSNGGHASTPGENTPLARLAKMITYFETHQVFDVYVSDIIVEMLKRLSSSMEGSMAFLYKYAGLFKPLLKKFMPKSSPMAKAMCQTTLAFTMASGSQAANVLPQEAHVVGDMRTSPHQGVKNSIEAVKKVASMFDVEVIPSYSDIEPNVADLNCKGFKLLEKAVDEVYEGSVITAPYVMNQCSDSKSVSIVCDNCLRFCPLIASSDQIATIHGLNENVDIACLEQAVDFYKYMMKNN